MIIGKGTRVRSRKVGKVAGFDGVVEGEFTEVGRMKYYKVRCPKGRLWCRDLDELKVLDDENSTET